MPPTTQEYDVETREGRSLAARDLIRRIAWVKGFKGPAKLGAFGWISRESGVTRARISALFRRQGYAPTLSWILEFAAGWRAKGVHVNVVVVNGKMTLTLERDADETCYRADVEAGDAVG